MNEKNEAMKMRILLALTDAYQNLEQEGVISTEELGKTLELLDKIEDCSPEETEEQLKKIYD